MREAGSASYLPPPTRLRHRKVGRSTRALVPRPGRLHGSYEALDGGSVTAALVDLTGGVGESIDMTDEDTVYEIADGSFWKRLKR